MPRSSVCATYKTLWNNNSPERLYRQFARVIKSYLLVKFPKASLLAACYDGSAKVYPRIYSDSDPSPTIGTDKIHKDNANTSSHSFRSRRNENGKVFADRSDHVRISAYIFTRPEYYFLLKNV